MAAQPLVVAVDAGAAAQRWDRGGPTAPTSCCVTLRRVSTNKIADVLSYTFDDSAKVLAYSVASRDSTKDGMYLRNMATGVVKTLAAGRGNYRDFTFDRTQQQFAFTSDHDEFGKPDARATLYLGNMKTATAVATIATAALPRDMHLADIRLSDLRGMVPRCSSISRHRPMTRFPPTRWLARRILICGITRMQIYNRRRSCKSDGTVTAPIPRFTTSRRKSSHSLLPTPSPVSA